MRIDGMCGVRWHGSRRSPSSTCSEPAGTAPGSGTPIHLNRDGAVRLTMAVADAIAREQRSVARPGTLDRAGRGRHGACAALPGAAGRPRSIAPGRQSRREPGHHAGGTEAMNDRNRSHAGTPTRADAASRPHPRRRVGRPRGDGSTSAVATAADDLVAGTPLEAVGCHLRRHVPGVLDLAIRGRRPPAGTAPQRPAPGVSHRRAVCRAESPARIRSGTSPRPIERLARLQVARGRSWLRPGDRRRAGRRGLCLSRRPRRGLLADAQARPDLRAVAAAGDDPPGAGQRSFLDSAAEAC